ncbi:small ribosomal subunit protein mS39 isoform X2 [Ptiloglossa arizonensis]
MWIYKQHGDLFPTNLSDPKIEAFVPPVVNIDKSQASEEALLQAISQFKSSDAIDIYKSLKGNVSNETKQALLELLCFTNGAEDIFDKLPLEQWALSTPQKVWLHNSEITELFEFLIMQDSAIVHMAYNAMLCGYAKWFKIEEAWSLYHECIENNIPLSIKTYNYIIALLEKTHNTNDKDKVKFILDIFTTMNNQRIRPNVTTLNAALKAVSSIKSHAIAIPFVRSLFNDFQRLNIELSLASYHYAITVIVRSGDKNSYQNFMKILKKVSQKKFTFQDLNDSKFFVTAMDAAFYSYASKEAANIINNFLFTDNNHQFMLTSTQESAYFQSYILLMLLTSTTQEFFEIYEKIVPHMYIPHKSVIKEICSSLRKCSHDVLIEYLPRLWSDMVDFELQETTLNISVVNMMDVVLSVKDSPSRKLCADIALSCWNFMMNEIKSESNIFFQVSTVSKIVLHVLRDDRVKEALQILTVIGKRTKQFTAIIQQERLKELCEICISKRCYAGAILLLEYCINFELEYAVEVSKILHNIPDLNDIDRDQLIKLTESRDLHSYDVPQIN